MEPAGGPDARKREVLEVEVGTLEVEDKGGGQVKDPGEGTSRELNGQRVF